MLGRMACNAARFVEYLFAPQHLLIVHITARGNTEVRRVEGDQLQPDIADFGAVMRVRVAMGRGAASLLRIGAVAKTGREERRGNANVNRKG